jgi:transcription antitermination factor NusG
MKWYAVMTNPRAEDIANRNLKRAGFHTFYPHERVKRKRKRPLLDTYVVEHVIRPYYPGYLFLMLRPEQGLYHANEAEGVGTIVHSGGVPLEIPHPVMDEIMAREEKVRDVDTVARIPYMVGQNVRFADNSPMAGLIAQIALDMGNQVMLWLTVLGAKRQVTVDPQVIAEIS